MSEDQRIAILLLHDAGRNAKWLAQTYKVHVSTIYRLLKGETSSRRPTGGRPSKFSKSMRRYIKLQLARYPHLTLRQLHSQHFPEVNFNSFRSLFNRIGYKRLTAVRRPVLSTRHILLRRQWCREYVDRTLYYWRSVWFVDEVMFRQSPAQRTVRFSVNIHNKRKEARILPTFKTPNSGMFFVAIRYGERPIVVPCNGKVNSKEYIRILCRAFSIQHRRLGVTLIQDRAPAHNSAHVRFTSFEI